MDQIISEYRKLLQLLTEEELLVAGYLQGELLGIYRDILKKEREIIEYRMRELQQIFL